MGGADKSLLEIDGVTLLERVLRRLSSQAGPLLINSNASPEHFRRFGLPILPDCRPGGHGPLAGILTGLQWTASLDLPWMVSVAADTPLFPADLLLRLRTAVADGAPMAIAVSNGRIHPLFALWPVHMGPAVCAALEQGNLSIGAFARDHGAAAVEWPGYPIDPFFNVNTPEDLATVGEILRRFDPIPR